MACHQGCCVRLTFMNVPQEFVALMQSHYGVEEADRLVHALQSTDPSVSVRINRRKIQTCMSEEEFSVVTSYLATRYEPVAWCADAWYLPARPAFTFDPLFHAGAYYVQEASSMYVADLLRRYLSSYKSNRPLAALDLCAAPGGKSTLLCNSLPEGSMLVSNEVIPKRALILAENMTKWTSGLPTGESYPVSSIVVQNSPSDFAAFANQFDLLLADVPCSGEGMFRKDEQAVRDWNLENVEQCCQRQRDILQDILPVLRPGGLLLYSTCTFNRFEDEDNARYACQLMGGEILEERHFLPGRDRGEGFYVALIRKPMVDQEQPSLDSLSKLSTRVHRYLRVLYDSIETSSSAAELPQVNLSYSQAVQYLRHEAVRVDAPRGIVNMCFRGFILGQGKSVGSRINNLYPAEWRIRSGYTSPFCLFGDTSEMG